MRTLLIFFMLATSAMAGPFLVSDPSPTAVGGQFEIQEGGVTVVTADTQPDGSIRTDLVDVTPGKHSYQVRYVKTDELWGTQTSDCVPFEFSRPSSATVNITGLKLVPAASN